MTRTHSGDPTIMDAEQPTGSTATYLSTESLTFPGMTGVSSIILVLYTKVSGHPVSNAPVLVIAALIGILLIVIGLLDPDRADPSGYGTFTQIVIGIFNTALLAAALFGITTIAAPAAG